MRILQTSLNLMGVSLLFAGQLVAAQNPGFGGPRGFVGRGGEFGFGAKVVTGEPYSGVRTTTFVQTLSDGTTINRTTTTNEARDSSGRFYRQTVVAGGSGSSKTMSSVFDPTNRTVTNWSSDKQQATVMQLPNFGGHRQGGATPENGEQRQFHHNGPTPVVTQLGSKTLSGIEVTGTRTIITFPAGSFGNNQAVTSTHERWVSQDLGVTVLETESDPRDGVRTTTLSDIQRTEPDATLFQIPQGYTVTQRTRGERF